MDSSYSSYVPNPFVCPHFDNLITALTKSLHLLLGGLVPITHLYISNFVHSRILIFVNVCMLQNNWISLKTDRTAVIITSLEFIGDVSSHIESINFESFNFSLSQKSSCRLRCILLKPYYHLIEPGDLHIGIYIISKSHYHYNGVLRKEITLVKANECNSNLKVLKRIKTNVLTLKSL